jgi:hypothetical protein
VTWHPQSRHPLSTYSTARRRPTTPLYWQQAKAAGRLKERGLWTHVDNGSWTGGF